MTVVKTWVTSIKDILKKSPLITNIILSLALVCLEKIEEMDFVCPCNPGYNYKFSAAFFVLPSLLVFQLMLIIQEWGCDFLLCCKNIIISAVSVVVWLILLFMDGKYYACAMTSWSGRFVALDTDYPQRWCEPASQNLTQECMTKTLEFFSESQGIGIRITIGLTVAMGVYTMYSIYCSCKSDSDSRDAKSLQTNGANAASTEEQDPEAFPLTTAELSSKTGLDTKITMNLKSCKN